MGTAATGELRKLANGYEARIRIEGKIRKGFALTAVAGETAARERCTAMALIASRLRAAGHSDKTEDLLKMAAKQRPGRPWEAVLAAVDTLTTAGGAVPMAGEAAPITWAKLGDEWTSGRLAAKHADHVRKKQHVDADQRFARLYVNPKIGDNAVRDARLEDFEAVMADLPAHLKPASRRHVAQYMSKLASLAVYPCRLLAASPIPRGWLPKGTGRLAMQCLRPAEDKALMASGAPLVRRLFFGVLAREGLRREELATILWSSLDLEHGAITLDVNKTDDPRSWALHPGVARALRAWRDRYRKDAPGDERVFIDEHGVMLSTAHMAAQLRVDLARAGVDRPELYARTDARQPLRVHDLRSTAVTVWLANGKSEAWCCDRTGHRSSVMLNRYRRAARSWSELGLGELLSLDEAIPELSAVVKDGAPVPSVPHAVPHETRRPLGGMAYAGDLKADRVSQDSPHAVKIDSDRVPSSPDLPPVGAVMGQSAGHADVETALAFALTEAAKAGRFDVVAQLAAELQARRLEGSNVAPLVAWRERR